MSQFTSPTDARAAFSQPILRLINQHLWIAEVQAKRLQSRLRYSVDSDELKQAGYVEICILAAQYKPDMGCSFSTFAWHRVKKTMRLLVRQEIKARRAASVLAGTEGMVLDVEPLDRVSHRRLLQGLKTLPPKEQQILEGSYLSETKLTVNNLSQALGLAPATIKRRKRDAILHLRKVVA